ncbi:MAG: ABC transporter permease [Bacteroidota bacterium]
MTTIDKLKRAINGFIAEYGIFLVLVFLIGLFSFLTISDEEYEGTAAAEQMAQVIDHDRMQLRVVIVASTSGPDIRMAERLEELVSGRGHLVLKRINGTPPDAGKAFRELEAEGKMVDYIAATKSVGSWTIVTQAHNKFKAFEQAEIVQPSSSRFPRFLKRDNLRNIADRIAVIAILAIGMTMVIITAGIDLSVGSLIALAAVSCALFIQQFGGGAEAGPMALILCSLAAILFCGMMGFFSGALSTTFQITPFIATLAVMMIARGLAYKFSNVTTIPITNDSFDWLGKGRMAGVPVSVVVMILLYAGAYFIMHWTTLGRRIYAIGGNTEAARLSGVPVNRVLLIVYTISGLLAGLGGVITASNLAGGAATYGDYYELYTIAAVVVGGSSLMGGQGKIFGTLIGAFIIAVIQSGMNQVGVESNTQKVVFGLVIVGAILSDKYKRKEISTLQLSLLLGAVALVGLGIVFFLRSIYPDA